MTEVSGLSLSPEAPNANSGRIKIMNLTTGKAVVLKPGAPLTFAGTFRITVADSGGDAMIERLEKAKDRSLEVAGEAVYELAHVRPLQLIKTDQGAFVLMRGFDLFVRPDTNPSDRLARLRNLIDTVSASIEVAKSGLLQSPPKVATIRSNVRIWSIGVTGALLSMLALAVWARNDGAVQSPGVPPEPPLAVPVSEVMPDPQGVMASAAPAPIVPNPVPSVVVPNIPDPTPPAQGGPDRVRKSPESSTPDRSRAPTSLKEEEVTRLRRQVESLLLEANYDPDKARRALLKLETTVPPGSALYREIEQAVSGVGP